MTQQVRVTFTFIASRESDAKTGMALFKKHFPEATENRGYSLDSPFRITCTANEFVQWMYERDRMGFVNRIHQLNLEIQVPTELHFPRYEVRAKLRLIEYTTPDARY